MPKRMGSIQRKSRYKFKRELRDQGKIPLNRYLQNLASGDAVSLVIMPAVQEGRFFSRFHGLNGVVTGKRGFCYQVRINDKGKDKTLYVHPVHLKKIQTMEV